MHLKKEVEKLFNEIGVTIGGSNPRDPIVYNDEVWGRIAGGGAVAMGETFMDKYWDVDDLADFVYRIQKSTFDWKSVISAGSMLFILRHKFFNLQIGHRAYEVAEEHYDLGNDLYQVMLDKRMIYTAGYWDNVDTLNAAQEAKLDLICRKLGLQKGQSILDIGCGWGGFMKYATEKYSVHCVGLSVSKEQITYAQELCAGLSIEFVLVDYQKYEPKQKFDHIVSIEMFEAVGQKNYRTYMNKVSDWLTDDGVFLLQTIASTQKKPLADPWIEKYIFPNGQLPNKQLIIQSTEGALDIHDWHSLGDSYDKTLMAWWSNFDKAYSSLDQTKYDERFYRMWKYYLHICAGGFRSGYLDVWQILMTKKGAEEEKIITKIR